MGEASANGVSQAAASNGTMKAAVCKSVLLPFRRLDEPESPDTDTNVIQANNVVIEDVEKPAPAPRELLIRVKAASLCHSDMSIVTGEWGDAFFPQIIGHEAVGVVEELGADALSWGFRVGDAVGAPLWHDMCLSCADCKTAGPQFCPTMKIKGVSCPGYFAEYAVMDAASAVRIPETAFHSFARELSPVFCAGITVWDALERAKVAPNETVAIYGADEQLEAVKGSGGADETINVLKHDSAALPTEFANLNGGTLADVVIVTSGVAAAYQGALSIVRPMGRVVMVGLPAAPIPVVTQHVTGKCISLVGSKVPGAAESKRCLDFTVRKSIYPKVNPKPFKLEDLNEMVKLMKAGKVEEGRMVVTL